MKILTMTVLGSVALGAAGCNVTAGGLGAGGGIPIETIVAVRKADGKVVYLKGATRARTANESSVELRVEGSPVTCSGNMTRSGGGQIACNDGLALALNFPAEFYGKTSGSFAGHGADGSKFAMGWGTHADIPTLQGLLRYER